MHAVPVAALKKCGRPAKNSFVTSRIWRITRWSPNANKSGGVAGGRARPARRGRCASVLPRASNRRRRRFRHPRRRPRSSSTPLGPP